MTGIFSRLACPAEARMAGFVTILISLSSAGSAWSQTLSGVDDERCQQCSCAAADADLLRENVTSERRAASTSSAGSAGHGSGGAHGPWWTNEFEYGHFESWCIVVMVLITLIFDFVHHKTEELAAEAGHHSTLTHHFSKDAKKAHRRNLWECLHQRCSGELSVLGFLAMTIWCCNQGELFDKLAKVDWGVDFALPPTGTDYLHTVEAVHMHLFLACILYFAFLTMPIYIATRLIEMCVDTNFKIKEAYSDGTLQDGKEAEYLAGQPYLSRGFFYLRSYYFVSLQLRRGNWPFLDEHINNVREDLITNYEDFDASSTHGNKGVQTKSWKDLGKAAQDQHHENYQKMTMNKMMHKWFPFDLYLVVNYRHTMDDMVEINPMTWLAIVIVLALEGVIQRFNKEEFGWTIGWIVICQVVIGTVAAMVWCMLPAVRKTVKDEQSGEIVGGDWIHKFRPMVYISRILQISLFFTMFEVASVIASKRKWEETVGQPITYVILFIIVSVAEGALIGVLLPLYSALMASGPYMTDLHVVRMQFITKAYARSSPMKLRQLADNIEEFDDEAEELEKELMTPQTPQVLPELKTPKPQEEDQTTIENI